MHICMVASEFPPKCGGLGYYVYHLSKNLTQRGYKITVLARGSWIRNYHQTTDGISVHRVRFLPLYPFHLQAHEPFLNRLLKSMEPELDIVHLHNHGIPIVNTSLPVVVTEHGIMKSFIDHLEPLDLFSLGLKMFSPMYISLDRKVLRRADNVIAISRTCAEELNTFYGIDNAVVITNGVDTNFLTPAKSKKQSLLVLYVGALTTEKGLPDLIRAATYVRRDYPDIKFILAGRGRMERNIKSLVHRLNLADSFFFAGYVERHQLREYYQQAAVLVLPSYHEGLPTVLLEAMACGIPSVATNVAGNSEVVVHGETGFLTPPKNPEKLAEAILRLLGDEKRRKTMGANARKRAEEHYDWGIITNKIEKIYTSLVS